MTRRGWVIEDRLPWEDTVLTQLLPLFSKEKSSHYFQRKKKVQWQHTCESPLLKYLLSIKRERIPFTICCDSLVLYQSPTKQLLVDFQCTVCTPWQISWHCTNSVMPDLFHGLLMSKLARTTPEHCWEAIPSNFSSCGSDPLQQVVMRTA